MLGIAQQTSKIRENVPLFDMISKIHRGTSVGKDSDDQVSSGGRNERFLELEVAYLFS